MIPDNYAEIYIEKEGSIMVGSQAGESLSYEYTWKIYYSDTPDEPWQSGDDIGWVGSKASWGDIGTDPILTRKLKGTYLNYVISVVFDSGIERSAEGTIPITIKDPGGTHTPIPYGIKLPEINV